MKGSRRACGRQYSTAQVLAAFGTDKSAAALPPSIARMPDESLVEWQSNLEPSELNSGFELDDEGEPEEYDDEFNMGDAC